MPSSRQERRTLLADRAVLGRCETSLWQRISAALRETKTIIFERWTVLLLLASKERCACCLKTLFFENALRAVQLETAIFLTNDRDFFLLCSMAAHYFYIFATV
jgi:hypothetical protein